MARSGDERQALRLQARHVTAGLGAGQSEIDHFGARTLARQYASRLPPDWSATRSTCNGLDDGVADDDCPRPRAMGEQPVAVAQAEIGGADEVAVLGQPHAADIGPVTVAGRKIRTIQCDLRQRQHPAQRRCVNHAKERFGAEHRQDRPARIAAMCGLIFAP